MSAATLATAIAAFSATTLILPTSALASGGTATASSSSLDFGTIVSFVTTADRTLTITNTGQGVLDLGTPTVNGNGAFLPPPIGPLPASTWFTLNATSTPCADAVLAVGASCSLDIDFAAAAISDLSPGEPDGILDATLTVPSDDTNSPLTIPLTGNIEQPSKPTASPSTVDFGSVPWGSTKTETITLVNKGPEITAPVTSESFAGAIQGLGEYVVVPGSDNCKGVSMPVGASCTIGISFTTDSDVGADEMSLDFFNSAYPFVLFGVSLSADPGPGPGITGGTPTTPTATTTPNPTRTSAPSQAPTVTLTKATAGGLTEVRGADSRSNTPTARVALSSPGTVTAVIAKNQHGKWRSLKSITVHASKAGTISIPLRDPALRPGTYRVSITDDVAGKSSAARHFFLHVRAARHH